MTKKDTATLKEVMAYYQVDHLSIRDFIKELSQNKGRWKLKMLMNLLGRKEE